MRILLTVFSCLLTLSALSQAVNKQQYIKLTYAPNQAYVEEAVESIQAISVILAKTTVEYRAGRSIELLPGFYASKESAFVAHIQSKSEFDIQLTAFPNPFEQSTTIDFNLPEAGIINLFVVDEKGQIVVSLLENSLQTAGKHQLQWNADAFSSGIYIPVLKTERKQVSSRVIKK